MDLDNVPPNLLLSAALGVWLMAAPAVLESTGRAADNHYLIGALVVTWSVIAFGEIVRPVRLLNIAIGRWLIASAWALGGHTDASRWNDVIAGVLLIPLSFFRGRISERFGSWNRYLI